MAGNESGKGGIPPRKISSEHERLVPFNEDKRLDVMGSKMVRAVIPGVDPRKQKGGLSNVPANLIHRLSNKAATDMVDLENMEALLPDLKLAEQIFTASVLSPNNMMSNKLLWNTSAKDLGEISVLMLNEIKNYFEEVYKIEPKLPEFLHEELFSKGAVIHAILPESAIDYAINSNRNMTMESADMKRVLASEFDDAGLPRSYGILGKSSITYGGTEKRVEKEEINFHKLTMESAGGSSKDYDPRTVDWLGITITDNPSVLKFPKFHDSIRQGRMTSTYQRKTALSMESAFNKSKDRRTNEDEITQKEIDALYPKNSFNFTPIVSLKSLSELDKPTEGHPFLLKLPPESVVVIHSPSDPSDHVGYMVVLDKNGNPLRASQSRDFFADLQFQSNVARDMNSQLLSQTRRATEGRRPDDQFVLEESMKMFEEVVEAEILSRLKNGLMGDNFKIANLNTAALMMFARACQHMQTQILFVPTTNMSYMANEYDENGRGLSRLAKTKIIGAIRSTLLFSDTIASMKNSVSHLEVGIELDPTDGDPEGTIEGIKHYIAKTRQSYNPVANINPAEIIDYFDNAGVNFSITGHAGFPTTKVTAEPKQMNYTKIDTELRDDMKKTQMMGLGVPPETVELSLAVDFATSVVQSNILLAKQCLLVQKDFTHDLSIFIRMYTTNSQPLRDKLLGIIEANKDKIEALKNPKITPQLMMIYFISSVSVALPEPDMSKIEMQLVEFKNFCDLLDATLPAFVSAEIYATEGMGENIGNAINMVVAILKAKYQRRWLMENNVMPQLFELVTFDDTKSSTKDILDEHEDMMASLNKSVSKLLLKMIPLAAKTDKAINGVRDANGAAPSAETTPAADNSGGGGEGGEAGGGFDELDFDEGAEAAGGATPESAPAPGSGEEVESAPAPTGEEESAPAPSAP